MTHGVSTAEVEALRPAGRRRSRLRAVAIVLAAACAVGGAYVWTRDPAAPYQPAAVDMRAEIVTGDHRRVQAALERWAPEDDLYATVPDGDEDETGNAAIRLTWKVPPLDRDPEKRAAWEVLIRDKRSDILVFADWALPTQDFPEERSPVASGWNGWQSAELAERYAWFRDEVQRPGGMMADHPNAVSVQLDAALEGPLVLNAILPDGPVPAADPHDELDVLLALRDGEEQHLHWVVRVPD